MPYSDADLLEKFRQDESDIVERKESIADMNVIAQVICAFSNDLANHREAGVLFVGQRDDKTCAGLAVSDDLLLRLSSLRSDGRILPFPVISVAKKTLDGCEVAVVIVEPSHNPPVGFNGRIWVRVGPRRATATAEEERRLTEKRRWGSLTFDAQPVASAEIADLDLKRFKLEYLPSVVSPEALRENGRSEEDQLRALRLLSRDGKPTATAVLMLGADPTSHIPGAYVQFVRYEGPDLDPDRILDQREIRGTLVDQVRRAEELINANIRRPHVVGGSVPSAPDYPSAALQQVLRNAILHRSYEGSNAPVRVNWYSDRVEISSPGGPYGQVTAQNFGTLGVTDYRNPTIAMVLKEMGFIERFGAGLETAARALRENGNPPLQYGVEPTYVLVTLRARQ